jgi:hypothetical protein
MLPAIERLVSLALLAAGATACWWGAYLGWRHALRGGYPPLDRLVAVVYMLACSVFGAAFVWMARLLLDLPVE